MGPFFSWSFDAVKESAVRLMIIAINLFGSDLETCGPGNRLTWGFLKTFHKSLNLSFCINLKNSSIFKFVAVVAECHSY